MHNVGPAPEMEVELAPRLNLITGDNGLGKSFLLDVAFWALTRRWPAEVNPHLTSGLMARPTNSGPASIAFCFSGKAKEENYQSEFNRRDQAWTGRPGRPSNPGLVIYAQVDGSFAIWDPHRDYRKTRGGTDVQDRIPAYVFTPQDVWNGLRYGETEVCSGLLADLVLWQKGDDDSYKRLKRVLKRLSPDGHPIKLGEPTRISLDDARWIPTILMPDGARVPVLMASAGLKRILSLAYLLTWSWTEHREAGRLLGEGPSKQITFLIDEIECHLHPRWQRTVIRSLLEVWKSFGRGEYVQLLVATHAPLVLASVETLFDHEQDAWFDLDLEDKAIHLRKRNYVPRGEVSNWLTSQAFDLQQPRSLESEAAIENARSLLRGSAPTPEQLESAHRQLLEAAVPATDPFWVRWQAFYESLR